MLLNVNFVVLSKQLVMLSTSSANLVLRSKSALIPLGHMRRE